MGILNNLKFSNDTRYKTIDSKVSIECIKEMIDILYKDNKKSYSSNFMDFILKQPINIIECIKRRYDSNEIFSNHIDECGFYGRLFTSEDELEILISLIEHGLKIDWDVFFDYIEEGGKLDIAKKLLEAIKLSEVNMYYSSIADLIRNPIIEKISVGDISNIIKVCTDNFEDEYESLDEEDLGILSEPLIKYCKTLNIDQLNFIKRLNEYVSTNCLSLMKYNKLLFANLDIANDILDEMIKAKYDNSLIEKTMQIIKEAYDKNLLIDKTDLNLIKNKIVNGTILENIMIVANIVSNCTFEFSIEKYRRIIELKKTVSKNVYKRFLKSERLLDECCYYYCYSRLNDISSIIEFGQLKEAEVLNICEHCSSNASTIDRLINNLKELNYKLSYEEFGIVLHDSSFVNSELLNSFVGIKSSERLLKIKEAVRIGKIVSSSNIIKSYEQVMYATNGTLINRLMEKNNPLNLKSFHEYVEYIVLSKKFEINDIRTFNLIKHTYNESNGDVTIEDLEKSIMELDRTKEILSYLNLSDEFLKKHKDNLIDFLISNNSMLLRSYFNNYHARKLQKENIVLIAKSIIAGEYENLKFVKDDIFNEIKVTMDNEQFEAWKRTDVLAEGDIKIEDASDFETIMTIGAQPVTSCMNYKNGSYSYCLLSNFDTSKKILKIYKKDKYIGRAILRLTKMSEDGNISNNDTTLKFIDFDSTRKSKPKEVDNEEIILFLERLYTSASSEFKEIYPIVKKHLLAKADSIGAKLVVSSDYRYYESDNDKDVVSRYVFITGSKNGEQYLDSFGGGTSREHCYRRGDVIVYN